MELKELLKELEDLYTELALAKDGDNKEFVKNRNKKYSGEFKKAQEYYDMNKEEDKEENDNNEDTKTNTMRNQFAGKLEIIDGMGSRNKKE